MSGQASHVFFNITPPETSGTHQVLSVATSGAAANYDWATALGTDVPKGSVFITLEASGFDVFVRFKATTAAAGTTVVNGLLVKADQPGRTWKVNPARHGVIDMIADGVGTLQVHVSSPIMERNTI